MEVALLGWTLLSILIPVLLWIVFFVPLNQIRDLSDVGYGHLRGKIRKEAINRARRARKVGERLPPPFPNGWYALFESRDLKVGQAKSIDCLGENFAVFRAEDGQVHVLNAYCPHLGANLGVGGIVRGDKLECPFHQWSFRGSDGECVNVPYCDAVPRGTRIKRWISREVNDAIFVWYHREDAEPWEIEAFEEIEEGGRWCFHGRNEFVVGCHIQDIPENGADVAHLATVHTSNFMGGGDISKMRTFLDCFGIHAWDIKWLDSDIPHVSSFMIKHSIRLFQKLEVSEIHAKVSQIGPAMVHLLFKSTFGPMMLVQTVTPLEPLLQKVIHRIYAPRGTAWFSKFLLFGETVMFERDTCVWNHKQYVDRPLLVKEDRRIRIFRQWYAQFYSENSTSFSLAKESFAW